MDSAARNQVNPQIIADEAGAPVASARKADREGREAAAGHVHDDARDGMRACGERFWGTPR